MKASLPVAHAVKTTGALVKLPLSPERRQGLDRFERYLESMHMSCVLMILILDPIRRHIESIPEPGTKSAKYRFPVSSFKFLRESARLKGELDRACKNLHASPKPNPTLSPDSRNECIVEIAAIGTRGAGAICEIPVLNLLRPAVGMVGLICDTAKAGNSNRAASRALARHAQDVTSYIVVRTTALLGETHADSLTALHLALKEVQAFLVLLQSRRRATSWILASKDKDRFTEFNGALDRALAVFPEIIETAERMRASTQELTALVAMVHRVEDDVKRTMMVTRQDIFQSFRPNFRAVI
ncbi:hypothetical protein B0H13DRAFT_2666032 [Mycena leptocephala]|nr:hypothetical protein B0H13DRAFT_2666032 [Mycena leptocephala]